MTDPARPGRMLFVNIPVADVERSKAFFANEHVRSEALARYRRLEVRAAPRAAGHSDAGGLQGRDVEL
jgi:hypothetical protein